MRCIEILFEHINRVWPKIGRSYILEEINTSCLEFCLQNRLLAETIFGASKAFVLEQKVLKRFFCLWLLWSIS